MLLLLLLGVKHTHIICDMCRENGVLGMRWKCSKCYDFDLCTLCYNGGKHSLDHEFVRMERTDGPRLVVSECCHVVKGELRRDDQG